VELARELEERGARLGERRPGARNHRLRGEIGLQGERKLLAEPCLAQAPIAVRAWQQVALEEALEGAQRVECALEGSRPSRMAFHETTHLLLQEGDATSVRPEGVLGEDPGGAGQGRTCLGKEAREPLELAYHALHPARLGGEVSVEEVREAARHDLPRVIAGKGVVQAGVSRPFPKFPEVEELELDSVPHDLGVDSVVLMRERGRERNEILALGLELCLAPGDRLWREIREVSVESMIAHVGGEVRLRAKETVQVRPGQPGQRGRAAGFADRRPLGRLRRHRVGLLARRRSLSLAREGQTGRQKRQRENEGGVHGTAV
jgi:hypothetical protein